MLSIHVIRLWTTFYKLRVETFYYQTTWKPVKPEVVRHGAALKTEKKRARVRVASRETISSKQVLKTDSK